MGYWDGIAGPSRELRLLDFRTFTFSIKDEVATRRVQFGTNDLRWIIHWLRHELGQHNPNNLPNFEGTITREVSIEVLEPQIRGFTRRSITPVQTIKWILRARPQSELIEDVGWLGWNPAMGLRMEPGSLEALADEE
ncbi:hypothetical protein VP1G_11468 [Cytospora mali]|nr:hypothetical protein VP1G_11468 [Valsa mali var. pyri (nom. inval.)]